MEYKRRNTRETAVGSVKLGTEHPIAVQSMTNTDTHDFAATCKQIIELDTAGCDIVRVTVPDENAAELFGYARRQGIGTPLVADIHFDYKAAIASAKAGASKIRINPGNIGAEWKVREVAETCNAFGIPIRIGVNGGSLDKALLEKYGSPMPEALVESALLQAEMLEKYSFSDIVLSMKSSDVRSTIAAYRLAAEKCDYPLHLGVTEAGDDYSGIIKSSVGIGSLLCDGIGDTIRVSLTADPIKEVKAGIELLRSIGLYTYGGINVISCPTCGRTKIDLISLASEFKEAASSVDTKGKTIGVAIMGCVVNGPGEAKGADVGIAGGDGSAVLFKNGQIVETIKENEIIPRLIAEVQKIIG